IGHRQVLIGSALAVAVFYLPQTFASAPWQLLILQALTGLASGGIVSAPSALLAQYTPHGEEGAVFGLDNSVWSGARAIAPMVGSAVAVAFGIRVTFVLAAILSVMVAGVAYALLPRVRRPAAVVQAESAAD
ncbi:MAG: MFS transporter, partial [Anaerolineae bacterium]|nr:MFS transporter [Anaerolineae bacterium]